MRAATCLDPILTDIVAAVRAHLSPTRIILFGSRARGDAREDSDYDILVETDRPVTAADSWSAVQAARGARRVSIDLHVRARGELERRAPDPGWIDGVIVEEGVLLYREPGVVAGGGQPQRVRETPPEEWESIAEWLRFAERDMRVAELSMAQPEPLWEIIAFHAKQAAEKTLKVALVQRGRRPPRTHELTELLAELRHTDATLIDLQADCERLERYAVGGRYPGAVAIPTDEEGRALVAAARRIIAAVAPPR
jgi:HEPN domain-containing protein/predicted nucleotidyltransferase